MSASCRFTHDVLTDDDLHTFKTKTCWKEKRSLCSLGAGRCHFSHNLFWPRRCPNHEGALLYIPELCSEIELGPDGSFESNGCRRGGECRFAHSVEEMEYHPLNYKTEACPNQENCGVYFCPRYHIIAEKRVNTLQYILPTASDRPLTSREGALSSVDTNDTSSVNNAANDAKDEPDYPGRSRSNTSLNEHLRTLLKMVVDGDERLMKRLSAADWDEALRSVVNLWGAILDKRTVAQGALSLKIDSQKADVTDDHQRWEAYNTSATKDSHGFLPLQKMYNSRECW